MAREQKTAQLTIRLRPSAKRLLREMAEADDVSVSALIERLARAEAGRRIGSKRG